MISISQEMKIQKTTGCTESHQSFPLTLRLEHHEEESDSVSVSEDSCILPYYKAIIWVFTNMSGMLLIDLKGLIIDCNPIFVQLALGYSRDQLVGCVRNLLIYLVLCIFLAFEEQQIKNDRIPEERTLLKHSFNFFNKFNKFSVIYLNYLGAWGNSSEFHRSSLRSIPQHSETQEWILHSRFLFY